MRLMVRVTGRVRVRGRVRGAFRVICYMWWLVKKCNVTHLISMKQFFDSDSFLLLFFWQTKNRILLLHCVASLVTSHSSLLYSLLIRILAFLYPPKRNQNANFVPASLMKVVDSLVGLIIVKACAFGNQVTRGCVEIKESLTYMASEARSSWLRQGERWDVRVRGERWEVGGRGVGGERWEVRREGGEGRGERLEFRGDMWEVRGERW